VGFDPGKDIGRDVAGCSGRQSLRRKGKKEENIISTKRSKNGLTGQNARNV
jgi:hypothetical protein